MKRLFLGPSIVPTPCNIRQYENNTNVVHLQCSLHPSSKDRTQQLQPKALNLHPNIQNCNVCYTTLFFQQQYFVGLTIFCRIILIFNLNDGILHIIPLVPQNIVIELNNVMYGTKVSIN